MDEVSDAEKIKALWDTHVLPFAQSPPLTQEDRELALLDALRHYRLHAKKAAALEPPTSHLEWASALTGGRIVWTLLAMEVADWMLEIDPQGKITREDLDPRTPEGDRSDLLHMLRDTSDYFSEVLDPVGLVLPRSVIKNLRKALIALDFGTTLPIVSAAAGGSKYFERKLVTRAVEHVHFLAGQGMKLYKAQERVSSAIGRPASTLRGWEGAIKKDTLGKLLLKRAKAAGELNQKLELNPDYGKGDGQSIRLDVWETLASFKAEPLKEFGLKWTGTSWGNVSAEKDG